METLVRSINNENDILLVLFAKSRLAELFGYRANDISEKGCFVVCEGW